MGTRTALRFPVDYSASLLRPDGRAVKGHLRDVSGDGVQFFSHEGVEPGEVVRLSVRVPDGESVRGRAEVVWSRPGDRVLAGERYSFALGLRAVS